MAVRETKGKKKRKKTKGKLNQHTERKGKKVRKKKRMEEKTAKRKIDRGK